ncbi:PREDICTED: uncharacterized protein LOC107328290 [Acropora digitifera]|uniref:uncharacterized protein LOC107328290 n=1 Tax=Acropora digitifera TaxID=70779 RepID=UPI00077AA173|nr:PREDICTED: uncharacterized protein LOC107328290 [Acropora digitifera]
MSCCQDDRLHLLRLCPGEELICPHNYSDEAVSSGWEKWFEVPHTQTKESKEDISEAVGTSSEPETTAQGVESRKRKRNENFTGHSSHLPPKRKQRIKKNESAQPADKSVVDDDVLLLAHELGSSWKMVGRALNVPDAEIDCIEANETEVKERCYCVLRRWREMYPSNAKYRRLASALRHPAVGRADLADKYCGL